MDSFPIPAVRLIISNDKGEVLLLQRPKDAHGGEGWCLPGGKVDYGQTVEETVPKELAEETALECTSARFLFYQNSLPYKPGGMHCINLYFECQAQGAITLNGESIAYAWVAPGDLDRYRVVFRNDEGLRRYWGR